jgi:urease accessory protein UreH
VVTSTLGPGLLAGDVFATEIDVCAGATLAVAAQMATPIFASGPASPRERASRTELRPRVAAGATLYAANEPLLLAPGAQHETRTGIDVSGDGLAVLGEIVVLAPQARLRSRTSARIDGRLALRDACDLTGSANEPALLTVCAIGSDAARLAGFERAVTCALAEQPQLRAGVGFTQGAVIVRVRAPGAWALQQLLARIVAALRAARPKEAPYVKSERVA